jgi:2-polyprenyl-3-methyl-5-hydroxy-6-metoxy-1,4-benzoquinol methylase
MPDWQERITTGTPPAIRVEHDARYRLVSGAIADSLVWCDLGCGNGLAAAEALGEARPKRSVLVDVDEPATQQAARALGAGAEAIVADLTDAGDLERVSSATTAGRGSKRIVTCFEVVEHLETFVPLVEALRALGERGVDVVLSVPNDAFGAVENPHHRTMWGEGSFDELRRLLPEGTVLLHQLALQGSAVTPAAAEPAEQHLTVTIDAAGTVPTHFLAAFGPRAGRLALTAAIVQNDLSAQRTWERQRDANASLVPELFALNREQGEVIERNSQWFAEWRDYIHDLERRLGLPLSGVAPDELPSERAQPALPEAGS